MDGENGMDRIVRSTLPAAIVDALFSAPHSSEYSAGKQASPHIGELSTLHGGLNAFEVSVMYVRIT